MPLNYPKGLSPEAVIDALLTIENFLDVQDKIKEDWVADSIADITVIHEMVSQDLK